MAQGTADVAVIGGGVHGCATAYHLAEKGMKVVLFEREYLSSGASGRSAAGIRMQFGTEVNCRLAKYNVDLFSHLQEDLGYEADLEFDPSGYLWVAYSDSQLEQLKKNVALQNSIGAPSEVLDVEGISEVAPWLNTEGMVGASWCHRDGHINPHRLNFAYADAAKRLGVDVRTYTTVTGLTTSHDGARVTGVQTTAGDWDVKAVVCAAGPWTVELAKQVGLDIPVTPERHQILITEAVERMQHPMTLCLDDGSYFKQCPNGTFMLGWGNPHEKKDTSYEVSWDFLEQVSRRVLAKMPVLSGVRVVRQWTGPYDLTPDQQAILGPTPVDGFYVDCGWSGHGLQFAPSAGRVLAEMIAGEEPFMDVHCFRYTRFEDEDLFFEPACI
ncbi:MAG: FAD-binding oxidoreductase [Synergistales bacterium]|nr:FAD-binding oxidoreductase [Synergistales bacterium]